MEINKRKNLYFNPNNNEEFHQNNIYRNLELSMKIKKIITNSTNKKENKLKINTNNFMNSINNIVTENKKRIKQNQGELKTLLNYINNKVKLSDSQYTKKIPKKSEETSNKIDKKYDKKNFKIHQMHRNNTTYAKNFNCIKNGLNQIYKKTLIINEGNYNFMQKNKNKNNKNKKFLKTSESVNILRTNLNTINYNIPKTIYIPKKTSSVIKMSPIYHKKIEPKYHNVYSNKKVSTFYYFSSAKKNSLNKNNLHDDNYYDSNRFTYSKKYSYSNPNFFKLTNTIEKNNENKKYKNKNFFKDFFEKEIDEISSIRNNSSYDSCTFDNENENCSNMNKIKITLENNDNMKNNHDDIISYNNNKKDYKYYKEKKYSGTITKNKTSIKKFNMILNNNNNNYNEESNNVSVKRNLRYNDCEKKYSNNQNSKNSLIKSQQLAKYNTSFKSKEKRVFLNQLTKKENSFYHLDNLFIIEQRLKKVIDALNKNEIVYYACFDFLNYFRFNCDIFHNLDILISNEHDLKVIKNGINYIIISIIFTYDYSYKQNILNNIILYVKEMLNLSYQNLILVYNYLFNKTAISFDKDTCYFKLKEIISSFLEKNDKGIYQSLDYISNTEDNKENKNNIELIKNNTNFIFQTIKIIIKNCKNKNSTLLFNFLNEKYKISNLKDIFYFFKNKIMNSNGLFSYLSPELFLRQNRKKQVPCTLSLPNFSKKKFSLVLGLEGTLVNFKFEPNKNFRGIFDNLRLRPGVAKFLSEIKNYFELIIFSLYNQKIADYLINELEKKEKYFDYRFYAENSIIVDNEFIKDIKRIGRPLDKIIIVDNLPQNYQLNKKNAINISSYWGGDNNDNTLEKLGKILIKIIKEGGDIRKQIEKYKNEISFL